MEDIVLVINSGSSTIKFCLFSRDQLTLLYRGKMENLDEVPYLEVFNARREEVLRRSIVVCGYEAALCELFDWLDSLSSDFRLRVVGHRVVHGGAYFSEPTLVDHSVIERMVSLNPLAPLHQPYNIAAIQLISERYPNLLQVACFDTAFHRTQSKLDTLFALPRYLMEKGVIRYGFHGISYEYIASVMESYIGEHSEKRVIVAHLGNGASLCAMRQGKSVATSMGFTALDGLMMGSRCGSIDPGILLYLLQEEKISTDKLSDLLYKRSGLLGVSGISGDMRKLQSNADTHAIEAVDLFCYRAAKELGALCVSLGGCDVIIFTAGIGENSAIVRKKICDHLGWLGVVVDEEANIQHKPLIQQRDSRVLVGVIPTNEEYMMAKHAIKFLIFQKKCNYSPRPQRD